MKILVFSDSHGKASGIGKALEIHGDASFIVHCGDGVFDLLSLTKDFQKEKIKTVFGNTEDHFGREEKYIIFECMNKRILVTHGHRFRHIVYGYYPSSDLIETACKENIDIVLHGHTHKRLEHYIPQDELPVPRKNGLYIFNPGSISSPRDGLMKSYGLLEIRENGILFSHADL